MMSFYYLVNKTKWAKATNQAIALTILILYKVKEMK